MGSSGSCSTRLGSKMRLLCHTSRTMARLITTTAYKLVSTATTANHVKPFLVFPHVRFCQSNSSASLPVLTLFTKYNCQLCDEALEELSPFLHQVQLKEVDIEEEGRENEYNKFRYEIPVFFLNNKFLCKNRIDLDKFHCAIHSIKSLSEH